MQRNALITGGHGGLGRAVVAAFEAAGWRVLAPTRAEADLSDPEAVRRVVEAAGTLQAVVNLVGGFAAEQPIADTPIEQFERMFALNLRPTYLVTQAALPRLSADGAVVCVSSAAARKPFAGAAGYAASKAAVTAFAKTLAAEGVRCNVVVPSMIDTPANRASMPDAKMVAPESIAAVILFLCSPESAALDGAELDV
jgi:NAD(P)-dependent dehydrogenase (short-subunit alcohol dehydrogenase family)